MTTIAEAAAKQQSDAIYVAWAQAGHFFNTPGMTMLQLKAVTAENKRLTMLCARADAAVTELRAQIAKSFPPPTPGGMLVDIDGGDMILPIMDGPWAGHYLSWNPALGSVKHLRYPEPNGSKFIVGSANGRYCWWTLKQ